MSFNNHIASFSALDIEKYHKGLLSAAERHRMEKAALEDPFLADAMEGYTTAEVDVGADMAELKKRLFQKTEETKVVPLAIGQAGAKPFPWLRVAAAVVIIGGAALLANQFIFNKKTENELAVVTNTPNKNNTTIDTIGTAKSAEDDSKKVTAVADDGSSREIATTTPTGKVQDGIGTAGEPIIVMPAEATKVATQEVKAITNTTASTAEKMDDIAKPEAVVEREAKEEAKFKKEIFNDKVANAKTIAPAAPAKKMVAESVINQQATRLFRGRITDNSNNGLPFAKVYNPSDNNAGTYTDAYGNFTLTYPDTVLRVQVRALGYETVATNLQTNITNNRIVMPDDRSVSDIVISNQRVNTNMRSANNNINNRQLIEPEPSDGWANYDAYIANNLEVPEELGLTEKRKGGYVQISFEVDKNGEPVNITVDKSLCTSCDKEAIRLVKEGPKWKRTANKHGRTTVTINF
jgi:hypothetical protein